MIVTKILDFLCHFYVIFQCNVWFFLEKFITILSNCGYLGFLFGGTRPNEPNLRAASPGRMEFRAHIRAFGRNMNLKLYVAISDGQTIIYGMEHLPES